jgi:hypothetical protein
VFVLRNMMEREKRGRSRQAGACLASSTRMTSSDLESEFSANRLRLNDRSDALNAYDVALPPLDVSAPEHDAPLLEVTDAPVLDEEEGDRCSICLNDFRDRAVLPACSHEFCFECISIWTGTLIRPLGSMTDSMADNLLRRAKSAMSPLHRLYR